MAGGSQKMFGDVSGGRLAEAQKFADQGNWGQAAQQYQLGGGQGFSQPQAQAFAQQYGNAPQLGVGGTMSNISAPTPSEWSPQIGGLIGANQPNIGVGGVVGPSIPQPPTPPSYPPTPPSHQPTPPQLIGGQIPGLLQDPTSPVVNAPPAYAGHKQVSGGRLAEAQRLAGLGKMGRAKQQWELGGGTWGGDAQRFLKG